MWSVGAKSVNISVKSFQRSSYLGVSDGQRLREQIRTDRQNQRWVELSHVHVDDDTYLGFAYCDENAKISQSLRQAVIKLMMTDDFIAATNTDVSIAAVISSGRDTHVA